MKTLETTTFVLGGKTYEVCGWQSDKERCIFVVHNSVVVSPYYTVELWIAADFQVAWKSDPVSLLRLFAEQHVREGCMWQPLSLFDDDERREHAEHNY